MKNNSNDKILNLVLISLVAFALVKIVYVLIESFVLPNEGVNHTVDSSVKPLYYKVKLDKQENIYNGKKTSKKHISSIRDIKLIAIYASDDTVVVTVVYRGKTQVLSKGDKVNGFKLIAGTSSYALFEKNGKSYKVDLAEHKINGRSSINVISSKAHTDTTPKVEEEPMQEEDNVIEKDVFNHFINNMDDIYKNIGIREVKQGNKKLFKVAFIRRGSPFAKLGIRRGDIIKSINGQTIDSYNAAFTAYRSLKDADSLDVVVMRNNKELELEYEIK